MHPICIRNKLVGSSRFVPPGLKHITLHTEDFYSPIAEEIDRPYVQILGSFRLAWLLRQVKGIEVSA